MGFNDKYADLSYMIGEICPYFTPLIKLRNELNDVFTSYFKSRGL
jgi:hypothetical protein